MRTMLVLFIVMSGFVSNAQSSKPISSRDSLRYYRTEQRKLWILTNDSLRRTEAYQSLTTKIDLLESKSKNYNSTVLFGEILHANFKSFNESIAQSGFEAMNPLSFRFGLGSSIKSNRNIFDIYFFVVGLNHSSKNGNAQIKSALANAFQIDYGYDFIHSKRVSLYPYIGLSIRSSTLEYSNDVQTNPNFTNISNIVINDPKVQATSTRLGYQAGVGLDLVVAHDKVKGKPAVILFSKSGTNQTFSEDKFKIAGINYKPGIKHGDWLVSLGFKFIARR